MNDDSDTLSHTQTGLREGEEWITGINNPRKNHETAEGDFLVDPLSRHMMLLAAISTHKEASSSLSQAEIAGITKVFDALIDQVQIDLIASSESCLSKAVNCCDAVVGRGKGEEKSKLSHNPKIHRFLY